MSSHYSTPIPVRIRSKYAADPISGCWLWTDAKSSTGYTHVYFQGKRRLSHRLIYEFLVGPIPQGLDLDHLCRVRHCVNPDHLEPVTRRENLRRGLRGVLLPLDCPQGHEFTTENTTPSTRGQGRKCRMCSRLRARKIRAQKGIPICPHRQKQPQ